MPDEKAQAAYAELTKRGYFKSHPQAEMAARELERRGVLTPLPGEGVTVKGMTPQQSAAQVLAMQPKPNKAEKVSRLSKFVANTDELTPGMRQAIVKHGAGQALAEKDASSVRQQLTEPKSTHTLDHVIGAMAGAKPEDVGRIMENSPGIAGAIFKAIHGATAPESMPYFIGAPAAVGMAGKFAPQVSKAVSALFGVGAYHSAYQHIHNPTPEELKDPAKRKTSALIDLAIGGLALTHAFGGKGKSAQPKSATVAEKPKPTEAQKAADAIGAKSKVTPQSPAKPVEASVTRPVPEPGRIPYTAPTTPHSRAEAPSSAGHAEADHPLHSHVQTLIKASGDRFVKAKALYDHVKASATPEGRALRALEKKSGVRAAKKQFADDVRAMKAQHHERYILTPGESGARDIFHGNLHGIEEQRGGKPVTKPAEVETHVQAVMGQRDRGFARAGDAYKLWFAGRRSTPDLRAQFASHLLDLARTGRYNIETPSGNVQPKDIFTADTLDGGKARIYGLTEAKKGQGNATQEVVQQGGGKQQHQGNEGGGAQPESRGSRGTVNATQGVQQGKEEVGKGPSAQAVKAIADQVRVEGNVVIQKTRSGETRIETRSYLAAQRMAETIREQLAQPQAEVAPKPTPKPKVRKKPPTAAERRAADKANEDFHASLVGKKVNSYGGGIDTVLAVKPYPEIPGKYIYTVKDEQGFVRTHSTPITSKQVVGEAQAKPDATLVRAQAAASEGNLKPSEPAKPTSTKAQRLRGGRKDTGAVSMAALDDLITKTREGLKGIQEDFRKTADPASRSLQAGLTGRIIRFRNAERVRRNVIMGRAIGELERQYQKMTPAQQREFQYAIDEGNVSSLPANQQGHAAFARQLLDAKKAELIAAFRRAGVPKAKIPKLTVQDYFPRRFSDKPAGNSLIAPTPSKQETGFGGRRPLSGRKGYVKGRTRATLRESIEGPRADKVLRSDNPWTQLRGHFADIDKHIMALDTMKEMKDQGLVKYVKSGDVGKMQKSGWATVDDPLFKVRRPITGIDKSGKTFAMRIEAGKYMMPEPVANVLNNYLQPGMAGRPLYDATRAVGNTLNMAQLGLSFFHVTAEGLNSIFSESARGMKELAQPGTKGIGAVRTVASHVPGLNIYAPLHDFVRGNQMLREYYAPGSQGAQMATIIDALQKGGGRARMDANYRNSALPAFADAFRSKQVGKALATAPFAALESTGALIMHEIVPRIKMGAFMNMAEYELAKASSSGRPLSDDAARQVMSKAWDSVDNRFGQIVYDNTFMKRTLKDSLMLAMRAVGWNLGTMRELGGAATDTLTVARRGSGERLTHRMAYTASLVTGTAVAGAIMNRLMTGENPKETKDYFYPRTGRTLPNGKPERLELPTYMRDVAPVETATEQEGPFGTLAQAGRTAVSKANPLITDTWQQITNSDYKGKPISEFDLPFMQQLGDRLQAIVGNFEPISIEKAKQDKLSLLGVTNAPRSIDDPDSNYKTIRVPKVRQQGPRGPSRARKVH